MTASYEEIDTNPAFNRQHRFREIGAQRYIETYNDRESYPSIDDVRNELNMGENSFWTARRTLNRLYSGQLVDRTKNRFVAPVRDTAPKRWLVTSIQNNVKKHEGFWKAMEHWCRENNAELFVIPVHYDWKKSDPNGETKWFDESVIKHRADLKADLDLKVKLSPRFSIDCTRITATAVSPLSGMGALCQSTCTVFGHGSIALDYVPTPLDQERVWMATTGSCNLPADNYTPTKAGNKARFHHTMGALVVEESRTGLFYRHILADDQGGFYDFAGGEVRKYAKTGSKAEEKPPLALITGDEHWVWMNDESYEATYGVEGINHTLMPKEIIRHDAYDHASESHHNDQLTQYRRFWEGKSSIETELDYTLQAVAQTTLEGQKSIMVASNHLEHLDKWLEGKGPQHIQNLPIFHQIRAEQLRAVQAGETKTALELYAEIRQINLDNIVFLGVKTPTYMIGDINVGMHGDKGMKGARGSAASFAKATNKFIIGHGHGPKIVQGTMQVGAMEANLDYQSGLTDTDTVHGLIYPNGKRTLFTIRGGHWHA